LSVEERPWWQSPHTTPPPSTQAGTPPPTPPAPRHYTLSGDIPFEADSAALTIGAGTQLAVILEQVDQHHGSHINVDGHTNPVGGSKANGQALSEQRAAAVKAWFMAHGVPENIITALGWGSTRPIYPNPINEAQSAANRRCEITVLASTP
jgi:outer membrane protein OmpA-like peptidoglycan-associated protein